MITTKPYEGKYKKRETPIVFNQMPLAHEWCKGNGIEIGAAAHNPFGLEGCKNLAPKKNAEDWEFYCKAQAEMCGEYAEADYDGYADDARILRKNSQDYIIHSHVLEHLPNPLKAMDVWYRALKPGGILFMVIPLRDALAKDAERPLTTMDEIIRWWQDSKTVQNFDWAAHGAGPMGHVTVWTLDNLLEMVAWCNDKLEHSWNIVATEEVDSKVGNGQTVVLQKV